MTIECQSATTSIPIQIPTTLTAKTMEIVPSASPCYDPCSVAVTVTWINYTAGTLPAGQTVGITVDTVTPPNGSTLTPAPINSGDTVTYTFTVTGLLHTSTNIICPSPN